MTECITVAKADGALINDSFIDEMFLKLLTYPDDKGSSMLTDLRAGKPIELGAKNGIISHLGKSYGIDTPINDQLLRDLK